MAGDSLTNSLTNDHQPTITNQQSLTNNETTPELSSNRYCKSGATPGNMHNSATTTRSNIKVTRTTTRTKKNKNNDDDDDDDDHNNNHADKSKTSKRISGKLPSIVFTELTGTSGGQELKCKHQTYSRLLKEGHEVLKALPESTKMLGRWGSICHCP